MILTVIKGEAVVALFVAIVTMVTFLLWMYDHRRPGR